MAARLLPYLNEIVRAQPDPQLRRASRFVRATVLGDLYPQRAREELESVFKEAAGAGDQRAQVAAAVGIASQLVEQNSMDAADWLRRAADVYGGDMSTVPLIRVKYAKIAYQLGDYTTALQHAEEILADLDTAPGENEPRVNVNSVRLEALQLAAAAANNLGDRQKANRLRDEVDQELDRHGASDRARSIAQFNRLASTDSADDAGTGLLLAARSEFANPADQRDAALVTMRLANLDRHRRNDREAIDLAYTALRAAYASADLWTTAGIHEDLAELLARLPQPDRQMIATHLLASTVIGLRAAGVMLALHRPVQLDRALMMLTFLLARCPDDPPHSLTELAQTLTEAAGVDLQTLLASTERVAITVNPDGGGQTLSTGEMPGDSVTDALTFSTHWPPPAELNDPLGHPEHWQPMKTLLIGPEATSEQTQTVLDRLRATGWPALAGALEQLSRGHDPDAAGLGPIDRAVVDLFRKT